MPEYTRYWLLYRTRGGRRPVNDVLSQLPTAERAAVYAAMDDVISRGVDEAARHLRGEIWEVRANGVDNSYRLLFAREGYYGQILLALELFPKKTQKTPAAKIDLAERRLVEWRSRSDDE